ncbi:MAG TPA: TRAP transporter TatT component family protein, partial [Polyangiales bacterium]
GGAGCNLPALLIKGTVDGTQEFTEAKGNEFADPEMIGPVIAAGVVTAEGTLYYVPEYEPLLRSAIFGNVAYGVGWLSAQANDAELNGKYDDVERLNKRAGLLYARALQLTKRMLRLRDDGFDAALAGGIDAFRAWVDENFYEKDDAKVMLTAGTAYFVSMLKSEEGLAASVDIPYARYMVEKSVELDPELGGSQGLTILGTYWCTVPAMVGGNPQLGLELMNRAMQYTKRGNHGIMVSTAERCATALQNRKMFHDLLTEVIEAGDVPKYRLPNKLARHQAERLLKQIDELFYD